MQISAKIFLVFFSSFYPQRRCVRNSPHWKKNSKNLTFLRCILLLNGGDWFGQPLRSKAARKIAFFLGICPQNSEFLDVYNSSFYDSLRFSQLLKNPFAFNPLATRDFGIPKIRSDQNSSSTVTQERMNNLSVPSSTSTCSFKFTVACSHEFFYHRRSTNFWNWR